MLARELGSTGISCSVLGFGCSAMLGRSGKGDSLRALDAAWDAGITLYDTARSYGYGESEALLGQFLTGRRHQAVISTKFGIVPLRPPLWKRMAKPAARAVISLVPSMRATVRKQAGAQFTEGQFTLAVLEESIHLSLRKLGTDYVDLLFLHGAPASVLQQDDLLAAMQKLVDAGKVRAAGISADPDVIGLAVKLAPPPLRVLQFPCNIFDASAPELLESGSQKSASAIAFGAIANHPFGGVTRVQLCREILTLIAADPGIDPVLREKLGNVDDGVLSDVVLNLVLSHASIDTVVPAMMQLSHLAKNVAAVTNSRFSQDDLKELRNHLAKATPAQVNQ
jgi:aryl-alcohol dehydrogenase-like predicted oxidoreductase